MAVSEATASRAVEAWSLDGGKVLPAVTGCGCVYWTAPGCRPYRRVRECEAHRPAFAPRDLPSA